MQITFEVVLKPLEKDIHLGNPGVTHVHPHNE